MTNTLPELSRRSGQFDSPPGSRRLASLQFSVVCILSLLFGGVISTAETVHVAQPGDTLWKLAQRHQTTVAELQAANGMSGTVIRVGQKLVIPAKAATPAPAVAHETLWRTARVTHVQKFGEWVIESVQRDGDGLKNEGVRVRHRGTVVWASQPAIETAVDIYPGRGKPVVSKSEGRAADITGAGTALLFIRSFTDTKRFVADTEIFALEPGFKRLARLEGVPNEGATFKDADLDGIAEAIVYDESFVGLADNLVEAYLRPVTLRLGTNGFQPVAPLKPTPPPSAAEVQARAKQLRQELGNEQPPWNVLLPALCDLAFAGHLAQAKALFEQAAPWTGPERASKWREFEDCLKGSQWRPAPRPQRLPAKETKKP